MHQFRGTKTSHSKRKEWRSINKEEFMSFIGLTLLAGGRRAGMWPCGSCLWISSIHKSLPLIIFSIFPFILYAQKLFLYYIYFIYIIRFTFLPDQKSAFLPSSTVVFYMFFQNKMHWLESKHFLAGAGQRECTGGDGRVCIYHTRHGMRQNDRFNTII